MSKQKKGQDNHGKMKLIEFLLHAFFTIIIIDFIQNQYEINFIDLILF